MEQSTKNIILFITLALVIFSILIVIRRTKTEKYLESIQYVSNSADIIDYTNNYSNKTESNNLISNNTTNTQSTYTTDIKLNNIRNASKNNENIDSVSNPEPISNKVEEPVVQNNNITEEKNEPQKPTEQQTTQPKDSTPKKEEVAEIIEVQNTGSNKEVSDDTTAIIEIIENSTSENDKNEDTENLSSGETTEQKIENDSAEELPLDSEKNSELSNNNLNLEE